MRLPLIDTVDLHPIDPRPFKRFEFGPEESFLLGRIIRECGPEIVRNREFAIPPFEQTYIELDSRRLYEGIGAEMHGPIETSDTVLGFICYPHKKRDTILVLCDGPTGQRGGTAGVFYYWRLSPDRGEDNQTRMTWTTVDGSPSAALMLGSCSDMMTPEEHVELTNEWGVWSLHTNNADRDNGGKIAKRLAEEWRHSAGELRIAWAALLLLNRPTKLVRYETAPMTSGLYKGKRRVYAAHTRVVLGEERKVPLLKQLSLTERGPSRRHEVRGHFAHFGLGDRCEHDWEPTTLTPIKRWACTKCGGKRVWRTSFERGDASKGYVTKDYSTGATTMEIVQ